ALTAKSSGPNTGSSLRANDRPRAASSGAGAESFIGAHCSGAGRPRCRAAHCVHSPRPRIRPPDTMLQIPPTKLPRVGTTIFTVMSQMAAEHGAVNLGQGFPDFPVPQRLVEELDAAMRAGHNQYSPMTGAAVLREAIAGKAQRCYGATVDAGTEVTVTSGATEA